MERYKHSPITQQPSVRIRVEKMQRNKQLNKWPIKAALTCASRVAPPSGHFMNHKKRLQDDQFASQSPTQMVTHRKLTSSHQNTEVNSFVEVLG